MEHKISEYICSIASKKGVDIDQDTDLFETGILDSLQIIMFLTFLQDEFGIDFSNNELSFENFKSINTICKWIANKQ